MASDSPPSRAPRFFVLEKLNSGLHDTEYSKVDPVSGPALRCPRCEAPISALTWLPPYRITLELYGRSYGDLVKGPGDDYLVTESFADAFSMSGLTGFSGFHPAEIVRVRRQRRGPKPSPPRYLVVTPTYGGAAVDEAHSRIWRTSPMTCSLCRSTGVDAYDGFSLEPGSWTGADIFFVYGCGSLLVSDRFVRFAEKRAMDHMAMIPTEKYVWDPLRRYYPDGPPKNARA